MNTALAPEPTVRPPSLAQQLKAAKEAGNPATAKSILLAARALPPRTLGDEVTLAMINMELGDYAAALTWFDHIVELKPELADVHASRSLALQLLNRPADAAAAAERALALRPANLLALKVLAQNSIHLRRLAEARTACGRILQLNPQDKDAKSMLERCQSKPTLEGMLGDFATRTRTWQEIGAEHLLQQFVVGTEATETVIRARPETGPKAADGFAIPPVDLTMGYGAGDLDYYLTCGRRSYANLCGILDRQQVTLGPGDALLDWGCAAGRVVRCFTAESRRGCEVWGGDVHAPSIEWAKAHLTPSFRFFNCSSLPHLPFPDGKFKFIYAFSVLTHIVALRDLWLLEISRILAPGGCAILTVHNEDTWECFREKGMPEWMPSELRSETTLPGECVDVQGSTWYQTYTFFHSDYIRRVWGQYFRVAEIVPRAESYQTAVVLRKD